jgi:hypothetical protein
MSDPSERRPSRAPGATSIPSLRPEDARGRAAEFVAVARKHGWQAATAEVDMLPDRAFRWGISQGGVPAGALAAVRGAFTVNVAVFTGPSGTEGRLSYAGLTIGESHAEVVGVERTLALLRALGASAAAPVDYDN